MNNLLDLTPVALEEALHLKKGGTFWVKNIFAAIYRRGAKKLADLSLRRDVAGHLTGWDIVLPTMVRELRDEEDGTVKWLLQMTDGAQVETVLMRFASRATICISTECGCSMGCRFCATGQMGLLRPLTAGEIVGQVLLAQEQLMQLGAGLTNVVFMGMGEPFENTAAVLTAAAIISSDIGLAIAPRHITISTVGLIPGIARLAAEKSGYRLAVSLHSAIQEKRGQLMPAARGTTLEQLLAVCQQYNQLTRQRVFFEYAVLAGINDGEEDLVALADFVRRLDGHVNLLSWNQVAGSPYKPVTAEKLLEIQSRLTAMELRVLIRESRGRNIAAACGQLKAEIAATLQK